MGKSSGSIRSGGVGKGGADGNDIAKSDTKLSNKGSLNEITNRALKKDMQAHSALCIYLLVTEDL